MTHNVPDILQQLDVPDILQQLVTAVFFMQQLLNQNGRAVFRSSNQPRPPPPTCLLSYDGVGGAAFVGEVGYSFVCCTHSLPRKT